MKVSIIGAGFVGSTIAYSLIQKGIANEICLNDINVNKAEGEVMDLAHGLSFARETNIYAGSIEDTKNSDVIVITAGAGQKDGETRLDLVQKNYDIFKKIVPNLAKYSPNSILLIVANPVDVLTQIAWELSGFPKHRVIGSGTTLDTSRLKRVLSQYLKVSPFSVHATVLGEHGDSEFVHWSSATISNIPLSIYVDRMNIPWDKSIEHKIEEEVKNSAYKIIEAKGATYYAVALAVTKIVEAILRDEKCILTTSSSVDDTYIGIPTLIGREGAISTILPVLNSDEETKFKNSLNVLNNTFLSIKR